MIGRTNEPAGRDVRVGLRGEPLALVHDVEVGQLREVGVAVADETRRLARLQQPNLVQLLLDLGAAVLQTKDTKFIKST